MFVLKRPELFCLYVNSRSLNNPRKNGNRVTWVIWFFVFLGGIFIRSPPNRNELTGSFLGLSLVRFTCVAFVIVISCIFFFFPCSTRRRGFLVISECKCLSHSGNNVAWTWRRRLSVWPLLGCLFALELELDK